MIKKQLFSYFFVLLFFFAFCLSVHSTLVWTECEVLEKASDLNAECYFGSVRVHGEEVDSLVVLSYQEYYGNIDLEDSVQSALQDQVFNNKSFEDNGVTYNGFELVGLADEAEFLVNGKYLKINIYWTSSCAGYTQPNVTLIVIGAMILAISIFLFVVGRIKSDKEIRSRLLLLAAILLIVAVGFFILAALALFSIYPPGAIFPAFLGLIWLLPSLTLFFVRRMKDYKKITRILKVLAIGLLVLAILLFILALIFQMPIICM